MTSPPAWIRRLRASSRDVVAAVRPHASDAMFAPTRPIIDLRVPASRRAGERVVSLDPNLPTRR